MESLPAPPFRMSLPAPPLRASLPTPPSSTSLPPPPARMSLPAPPSIVEGRLVLLVMLSFPSLPESDALVIGVASNTLVTPFRLAVTTPRLVLRVMTSFKSVPNTLTIAPLRLPALFPPVAALNKIDVAPRVGVNDTPLPALKLLIANAPVLLAYFNGVKVAPLAGVKLLMRTVLIVPASAT